MTRLYRFVSSDGDSWIVPEVSEYLAWFVLCQIVKRSISELQEEGVTVELM